jgi:hypothetical protein
MSPLVSLWIHAFSTDLRVVSMTCDLLAEQRKRDRGKKNYERREEQRIRSETWVDHYARGALIEIYRNCLSFVVLALPRATRPHPHSCACSPSVPRAKDTGPAIGLLGSTRRGGAAKLRAMPSPGRCSAAVVGSKKQERIAKEKQILSQ